MSTPIPDSDHVARYCSNQKLEIDPETGDVLGVFPEAFRLRSDRETTLSVNHLQHRSDSRVGQLSGILADLAAKGLSVRPAAALAIIGVAAIKGIGKSHGRNLRVLTEKHEKDPSYAAIHGLPPENEDPALTQDLALEASKQLFRVRDLTV